MLNNIYDSDTGFAYGTYKSYIIGFALSVIITCVAFSIVEYKAFSNIHLYIFIALLALLQLYVQLIYFLHFNLDLRGRWNLIVFIFTMIICITLVAGTLWVMFDFYKMMMCKLL